jgi:hypothetical protein
MNKVKQGQSFADKVIQLTGGLDAMLTVAVENDKSITDNLQIGESLKTTVQTKKRVIAFFNLNNEPATKISDSAIESIHLGIGTMVIGTTFKVG